jgi:cholesterol oxidase
VQYQDYVGTNAQKTWHDLAGSQISGTIGYLHAAPTNFVTQIWRTLKVLLTWHQKGSPTPKQKGWAGFKNRLANWTQFFTQALTWWRIASRIAVPRVFVYDLKIRLADAPPIRLRGQKNLRYSRHGNPWHDISHLTLQQNVGLRKRSLALEVDMPYLCSTGAPQITQAPDALTGNGALLSLGALFARAITQIYCLDFKAPPYVSQHQSHARLPQAVRTQNGFVEPEKFWLNVQHNPPPLATGMVASGGSQDKKFTLQILLSRYKLAASQPTSPTLLIHGFGVSSQIFCTPTLPTNLVSHLLDKGHDVWLVDLRTSAALDSATLQTSLEEVAQNDIATAVQFILKMTGAEKINIHAHCIGSAMLCVGLLEGMTLPTHHSSAKARPLHEVVNRLVLTQVAPIFKVSTGNMLRGRLGALLKNYLPVKNWTVAADDSATPLERLYDRIAQTYSHQPLSEGACHEEADFAIDSATCNRISMLLGRNFSHANLSRATHQALGDIYGAYNLTTFVQLMQSALAGSLCDNSGEKLYTAPHQLARMAQFPILFMHGAKSQVFDVDTSRLSYQKITQARQDLGLDSNDNQFILLGDYEHLDVLIGERAHSEVFGYISDFFAGNNRTHYGRIVPEPAQPLHSVSPQPALVGPIIGWARPAPSATAEGAVDVRLWAQGQHSASDPILTARVFDTVTHQHTPLAPLDTYDASAIYCGDVRLRAGTRPGLEMITARQAESKQIFSELLGFVDKPWFKQILRVDGQASFVFGSCRFPGTLAERNLADAIFKPIAAQIENQVAANGTIQAGIDALLMVGDQIYADATANLADSKTPHERYRLAYQTAFSSPNLKQVLAHVPTYMAIDDHEIINDWRGMGSKKSLGNDYFVNGCRNAWDYQFAHSPSLGNAHKSRFWYEFELRGARFFVMDTRTERTLLKGNKEGVSGDLFSRTQYLALVQWLAGCAAQADVNRPCFIVSGVPIAPMFNQLVDEPELWQHEDGWGGYPQSLREFSEAVVHSGVKNLVLLSGDYHLSCASEVTFHAQNGKQARALSLVSSPFYAPIAFANAQRAEICTQAQSAEFVARYGMSYALLKTDAGQDAIYDENLNPDNREQIVTLNRNNFSRVSLKSSALGWQLLWQVFSEKGELCLEKTIHFAA